MTFNEGVLHGVRKLLRRAISYCGNMLKTGLKQGIYEPPKTWDNKSFNFGTLKKKCHLNVALWRSTKYTIGKRMMALFQV
jgi:hypothetical protein